MKRVLIRLGFVIALLMLGFWAGRFVQYAKNGYQHKVYAEKEIASPMGPVRWSRVYEFVGFPPPIDTDTTIIEWNGRTIYKAKRWFQEDYPHADNVAVAEKSISWDDGEYRFRLAVEPMRETDKAAQPGR